MPQTVCAAELPFVCVVDQADEEEVAAAGKVLPGPSLLELIRVVQAKEIGIDKTEVSDINQDAKKVSFGGRGRGLFLLTYCLPALCHMQRHVIQ